VVPRQSAARFPESFQERVRDSLSASAETARQDALRLPQALQPPAARMKAEFPTEPPAALVGAVRWAQRQAVPWMTADESVSAPGVSPQARAAQRALQPAEQRSAPPREPSPALSE
jgi:hypothetical protein